MALDQIDDAGLANRLASLVDASDWDGFIAVGLRHAGVDQPNQGLFLQMASRLRQAGLIDQSESCLREGLNRWPDDLWLGHRLADLATHHRDFEEAASRWNTMIARHPQSPVALCGLAELNRRSGRDDAAAELFEQADARYPDYVWAAHGHATSATRRRDWVEGARRRAGVCERFPAHAMAHEELARALIEGGNPDGAAQAVSRGLAAFPGSERLAAVSRRLPERQAAGQQAPAPAVARTGIAKLGKRARRRLRAK